MAKKPLPVVTVKLDKIVGGGQALGTLDDGRKIFAWGGLPTETVEVQTTKQKASFSEGVVTSVLAPASDRVAPRDPESYLSTSPWQIMDFQTEQQAKADLISEAFELHQTTLPGPVTVYTDGNDYHYRNKVEFSWYGDASSGSEQLHLAFFRRGSKGKIIVDQSALLPPAIMQLARSIRDSLQSAGVNARQLKTLLIRSSANSESAWQLYIKDNRLNAQEILQQIISQQLPNIVGGEIIFSDPRSPASVITKRLALQGSTTLSDTVLGVPFRYATESFFQVNLPVYEQALRDMQQWVPEGKPTVDLYSGVGSIGLTIGGSNTTLVEINEYAVKEMKRNISELGLSATPVLAASEQALSYITSDRTIIVDPPRIGLHEAVVDRLLEVKPDRIVYLSCNPVTQARDAMRLSQTYQISAHAGYNFFPRTPHIEHLVVLDRR